ncbi:MAG: hypothetical protein JWN70_784 [Planctomycetaceae bacterium]|nr:hypothetical protein [Planctomycetaceae bacterium]
MVTAAIQHSRFQRALTAAGSRLTELQLRRLVFNYCQKYQDDYSFDQLTNAFAYLDLTLSDGSDLLVADLKNVHQQVEEAIGEYFESLNEVAMAIHRLLDERPFTVSDALETIQHVWRAHSCNEAAEVFVEREDRILCEMISTLPSSA